MLFASTPIVTRTESHPKDLHTHVATAKPRLARFLRLECITLLWLGHLVFSDPGYAIQSHPAPEGLYAHQLAHVCFILSMGFLAYWLDAHRLSKRKGWRYIQIAALLFVVWNILAFIGHWVEEKIPKELFVGDPDWSQRFISGDNIWADIFYILKLDHVVSVPAILCLFLGLRLLYRDIKGDGDST